MGTVTYQDEEATIPFNGYDLWVKEPTTNSTYRMNSIGVITGIVPCG